MLFQSMPISTNARFPVLCSSYRSSMRVFFPQRLVILLKNSEGAIQGHVIAVRCNYSGVSHRCFKGKHTCFVINRGGKSCFVLI